MSKNTTTQKSTTAGMFSRYRGMIILIVVFLIAISGIMAGSAMLSREINYHNKEFIVIENLRTSYLEMTRALLGLKLNYGEDPNSPYVAHTLDTLKKNREQFQSSLNIVMNGGEIQSNGETVAIAAFEDDAHIDRAKLINDNWIPLSTQIDEYLKTATSPTSTGVALDLAVLTAQSSSELIDSNITTSMTALQEETARNANTLATLQAAGILGAIIFFIVFVFYSIRKMFAADIAAEAARKETTEIMDTVNTGLFLLDKDLVIGSQYSKHLESLLGQRDMGGKNLLDVLAGLLSDEELNTTHAFIGQLYNPRTKERLIGSLNPLARQPVTIQDGKKTTTRYLDFTFNRVYKDKEIARVLVNVSDVTDAVLLEQRIEQEREQNDVQLEMLSRILQADRTLILDFVRNTKAHNTNVNNILKAPGDRQSDLIEKAQTIFREIHSMKGEASSLKLHGFTVMAENLEAELNKLTKTSNLSGEHFLGLAVHLEELVRLTQTIDDLVSRLGGDFTAPTNTESNATSSTKQTMAQFYNQFVQELAQRNGKVVDFSYVGIEETEQSNINTTIREISLQLLRNAVVHGVEVPEQRQAKNKLASGHVRMELTDQENHYTLTLEDDGKGIDYKAIRDKAVRLGMYSAQDAEQLDSKALLGLIFSSGFSTLDESTEDAGRGVGLDIIKDRIVSLGGKISVATHAGAYTRFSFTFPK